MSDEVPAEPDCARCGALARADAKFCGACGSPLSGAPLPPRRPSVQAVMRELNASALPGRRTILFFVLWCASGVLAAWSGHLESRLAVAILLLIQGADALLSAGWALAFRRPALALLARLEGGPLSLLLPLLLAWPLACAVHLFVLFLHRSFSIQVIEYAEPYLAEGYGWTVIVLSVVVQPALIEELAFRGVIQSTLEDVMRPAEAVVIAALGFSIMHFNLVMFLPLLALGAYFGWLRRRFDSLWPPVLAHAAHNLLILVDEARPLFPS